MIGDPDLSIGSPNDRAHEDEINARIVPCEHCGSEGRLYSGHANDPNPRDEGPCPVCEGTGGEIIETEPVTLDDLCADGCQYAKDVAMYEHSCSGECQYLARAARDRPIKTAE